jgi:hypothetical protein
MNNEKVSGAALLRTFFTFAPIGHPARRNVDFNEENFHAV